MTTENRNAAAAAASTFLKGKTSDIELNACLDTIRSGSNAVPAKGSFVCAIFYWRITLDCNGKQFVGNAGAIGGAGGGSTHGDIYLASGVTLDELQSTTDAFQFNGAGVYLNVNFFNSNHKFLGSYQGGGIATCVGTGGGKGSWS
ncbi:VapA/VapB family virulence-associated protein [Chitinophaga vietnamensis]|uniref:VapA/VapB family virulence-associated protein n=1 Tax=Chitinophaga vietnamensis TaxID=2593957 RepID=UPI0011782EEA|nr:VapA/VapB family virulence-associated protein [Chitinophaga vietnamensis]